MQEGKQMPSLWAFAVPGVFGETSEPSPPPGCWLGSGKEDAGQVFLATL